MCDGIVTIKRTKIPVDGTDLHSEELTCSTCPVRLPTWWITWNVQGFNPYKPTVDKFLSAHPSCHDEKG